MLWPSRNLIGECVHGMNVARAVESRRVMCAVSGERAGPSEVYSYKMPLLGPWGCFGPVRGGAIQLGVAQHIRVAIVPLSERNHQITVYIDTAFYGDLEASVIPWCSWLSRQPNMLKVSGSNPDGVTPFSTCREQVPLVRGSCHTIIFRAPTSAPGKKSKMQDNDLHRIAMLADVTLRLWPSKQFILVNRT